MLNDLVVGALRLAGRPLGQAELVALRFGSDPTDAERKQIANAVRQLQETGRVATKMDRTRNARGAQRMQRVVELVAASLPVAEQDEPAGPAQTPDAQTPDAPVILADIGGYHLAVDYRAVHAFWRETGVSLADECDADCRRRSCIQPGIGPLGDGSSAAGRWRIDRPSPTGDELLARPEVARWLAAAPDPVVVAPDGSMWAVLPGAAVADVMAACQRERPLSGSIE